MAKQLNADGSVTTMSSAEETAYNDLQTEHNAKFKQYKVFRTSGLYDDSNKQQTKTVYGKLSEQLDMLYRDIDAGKLGDDAKTGEWYLHVKKVKDDNPKS